MAERPNATNEMIRWLSKDLRRRMKLHCAAQGVTMRKWLDGLIERALVEAETLDEGDEGYRTCSCVPCRNRRKREGIE